MRIDCCAFVNRALLFFVSSPLSNPPSASDDLTRLPMDYEALKEQWSEVEDRDGVRLSWNVFPSSRMVLDLVKHKTGPLSSWINRKPRD